MNDRHERIERIEKKTRREPQKYRMENMVIFSFSYADRRVSIYSVQPSVWKRWPNLSVVLFKLSVVIGQYLTMTF